MVADLKQMFARPVTWLAIVLFTVLLTSQAVLSRLMISGGAKSADFVRLSLFSSLLGLVLLVARIVTRFVLSRRLGNSDGLAGEPATGKFIGYAVVYEFIFGLFGAVIPLAIVRFGWSPKLLVFASSGARMLLALVLFTFAVRLVALAHSGNAVTHRMIRKALGWQWYAALAGIMLAANFVQYSIGANRPAAHLGVFLTGRVIAGFVQVLLMLLTIAAYRSAARQHGDISVVFD